MFERADSLRRAVDPVDIPPRAKSAAIMAWSPSTNPKWAGSFKPFPGFH
jgi:hypothetical protein